MPIWKHLSEEKTEIIAAKIWELQKKSKKESADIEHKEKELRCIINQALGIDLKTAAQAEKFKHHLNGGGILTGNSHANEKAFIGKNAIVGGDVWIRSDDVRIEDNAIVLGNIIIDGSVKIDMSAVVFGDAWLLDNVHITENVCAVGINGAMLAGNLIIKGNGIRSLKGYLGKDTITLK